MEKVKCLKSSNQKGFFVTETDASRLREMIDLMREVSDDRELLLSELEEKLSRAEMCHAESVSKRTVTMNTVVRVVFSRTGGEALFWLGYPSAVNYDGKKLSILTPPGIALLGSSVGDEVEWGVSPYRQSLTVKNILYQPESYGDYHL